MPLLKILQESLKLLYREPKIFVPRLITTALYTAVMVYAAGVTSQIAEATGYFQGDAASIDPAVVRALLGDLVAVLVSLLFLLLVDLVSYAMYPALIRDHSAGRPISLLGSLKEALGAWRILAVLGVVVVLFALAGSVFMALFQFMALETGELSFYLFAAFIVLAAALVLLVLLFFVVPVGVLEKKGVLDAFRHGFALSVRHKKDLFAINLFFLILTTVTFALMVLAETQYQGLVAYSSIILFIFVRVVQAVIYTYICVVNPYFYIKVR